MQSYMKAVNFQTHTLRMFWNKPRNGTPIGQVYRKTGIAETTFYDWLKRYTGLMSSEVKWLRQLLVESAKLKRLFCGR